MELAAFDAAALDDVVFDVSRYSRISLGGSSTLEVQPTTRFIQMIEGGEVTISFAAEVHLRSL